jgi:hypothetical protein
MRFTPFRNATVESFLSAAFSSFRLVFRGRILGRRQTLGAPLRSPWRCQISARRLVTYTTAGCCRSDGGRRAGSFTREHGHIYHRRCRTHPDEDGNPAGPVCIAVAPDDGKPQHIERRYGKIERDMVQQQAMVDALAEFIRLLETPWSRQGGIGQLMGA